MSRAMSDEKEMLFMHCQHDEYVRIREELGLLQDMAGLIKKLDRFLWKLSIKQAEEALERHSK